MNKKTILILGDILAIAILTLIGFATHRQADASYLPRMVTAFFPVLLSWFVLAPWFGLFDEQVNENPKLLWRVALVSLFAAPLATTLRAAWLGSTSLPLFTLILGSSNMLGMLVWRWIYIFIARRVSK
jgi:hypothetical protein